MNKRCVHYKIFKEIEQERPLEFCDEWRKRAKELPKTSGKTKLVGEEEYSCLCPACGKVVCNRCV